MELTGVAEKVLRSKTLKNAERYINFDSAFIPLFGSDFLLVGIDIYFKV